MMKFSLVTANVCYLHSGIARRWIEEPIDRSKPSLLDRQFVDLRKEHVPYLEQAHRRG